MQVGSILGLGLAYAGSNREDVLSLILPVMSDSKSTMEVRPDSTANPEVDISS